MRFLTWLVLGTLGMLAFAVLAFAILGQDLMRIGTASVSRSLCAATFISGLEQENERTQMKAKAVESEGIRLYSESFGSTEDPAVLLIMGATASGAWWPDEFCASLADSGRFVVRYDHRDTGGSTSYEPGAAPYNVEDLADDAVRVLDGYSIKVAHVVGMSLGGYITQLLALKYFSRILTITTIASERLAAADPAMPSIGPELLEYHSQAAELNWSDRDAIIEYLIGAWKLLAGSAHKFDSELIRKMAVADLARTPNPLTAFNHAGLGDAVGWIDRLEEIKQPALVIHGTDDIVLPYAHAEALYEELPNARLVKLQGIGHELPCAVWPNVLSEILQHTAERGPNAGKHADTCLHELLVGLPFAIHVV